MASTSPVLLEILVEPMYMGSVSSVDSSLDRQPTSWNVTPNALELNSGPKRNCVSTPPSTKTPDGRFLAVPDILSCAPTSPPSAVPPWLDARFLSKRRQYVNPGHVMSHGGVLSTIASTEIGAEGATAVLFPEHTARGRRDMGARNPNRAECRALTVWAARQHMHALAMRQDAGPLCLRLCLCIKLALPRMLWSYFTCWQIALQGEHASSV